MEYLKQQFDVIIIDTSLDSSNVYKACIGKCDILKRNSSRGDFIKAYLKTQGILPI